MKMLRRKDILTSSLAPAVLFPESSSLYLTFCSCPGPFLPSGPCAGGFGLIFRPIQVSFTCALSLLGSAHLPHLAFSTYKENNEFQLSLKMNLEALNSKDNSHNTKNAEQPGHNWDMKQDSSGIQAAGVIKHTLQDTDVRRNQSHSYSITRFSLLGNRSWHIGKHLSS